jgi:DNA-directed RNA polymerase subunit RPC12/RpoP
LAVPEETTEEAPAAAPAEHRWPCAQCGADLRYAPGQTVLKCEHCGHEQTIAPTPERKRRAALGELSLAKGLKDDLPTEASEDVRTTTCPNCGAQVEFRGAEHATLCPFCATPVVVDTGTRRVFKPQALIPFALTEDRARDALTAWMGRLWFAPNALLEYARKGRSMAGIYVPFWTYDADTASDYTGQRGDYYYVTEWVTVTVNGRPQRQQRQVRKTRWSHASGHVARGFDDVLVMASTSLPLRLGDDLAPWDLTALTAYNPDFLAGFQAEGYTVSLADGHKTARERMARVIEGDVRRDIGGDEQRITSVDTDFSNETFKHILLPMWTAAYKYGGKSYRFVVNGQTGEVQGERPWSAWKIAFAVLLGLIVAAAAFYVYDPQATGLPVPEWLDQ